MHPDPVLALHFPPGDDLIVHTPCKMNHWSSTIHFTDLNTGVERFSCACGEEIDMQTFFIKHRDLEIESGSWVDNVYR